MTKVIAKWLTHLRLFLMQGSSIYLPIEEAPHSGGKRQQHEKDFRIQISFVIAADGKNALMRSLMDIKVHS
jgi:hypothetical protein